MARTLVGYRRSVSTETLLDAPMPEHMLGGCSRADSPQREAGGLSGEEVGQPRLPVAALSTAPADLGVNPSLAPYVPKKHVRNPGPGRESTRGRVDRCGPVAGRSGGDHGCPRGGI